MQREDKSIKNIVENRRRTQHLRGRPDTDSFEETNGLLEKVRSSDLHGEFTLDIISIYFNTLERENAIALAIPLFDSDEIFKKITTDSTASLAWSETEENFTRKSPTEIPQSPTESTLQKVTHIPDVFKFLPTLSSNRRNRPANILEINKELLPTTTIKILTSAPTTIKTTNVELKTSSGPIDAIKPTTVTLNSKQKTTKKNQFSTNTGGTETTTTTTATKSTTSEAAKRSQEMEIQRSNGKVTTLPSTDLRPINDTKLPPGTTETTTMKRTTSEYSEDESSSVKERPILSGEFQDAVQSAITFKVEY